MEILQYDRESANGSCGLYVYERCEKDAYGGWSRQEAQILNIYAYRYWEDIAVASGKTGWGDAPSREYSELTGECPLRAAPCHFPPRICTAQPQM